MKTLTGPDRDQVDFTLVITTISALAALPKPDRYPHHNRLAPTELHTYRVRARFVEMFTEDDQDFHVILEGLNSHETLIAEIPAPQCAVGSGHQQEYARARAVVESLPKGSLVDVVGVAFFDLLHGQRGVAPNGIELHPVLSLTPVGHRR